MCRIFTICLSLTLFLLSQTVLGQEIITVEPFASGLSNPLSIHHAGDDRLFIVEKAGRIQILDNSGEKFPEPFLDISGRVNSQASERGLLGLAFHPQYTENGFFFVYYTNASGATTVSRFSRDTDDAADPESEKILLNVNQPFSNHNGGCLQFGPDGFLYIGLGDGGDGGDPGNRAQNPLNLLGKLLRIDVDKGDPYSIPESNPFINDEDYLAEIWAIGLRNPWRFSFDVVTGDLYIADVGQNAREEVNVEAAASSGGLNYGWRCYEAELTFNTSGCPDMSAFVFPVHSYAHQGNSCRASITGGYVYRGNSETELYGKYVYGDYCKGWIAMLYNNGDEWVNEQIHDHGPFEISSFGTSNDGRLFYSTIGSGEIYEIVPAPISSTDDPVKARTLSIYPNPTDHHISFDLPANSGTSSYDYTITDAKGAIVSQGKIEVNQGGSTTHDLPEQMKSGLYFLHLKAGSQEFSGKFLKQ